jgi:1,2-diacylglycerol 3-beta-galactosyltransferase
VNRIDFIFFDAGGGHRSAAMALKAVVKHQKRPWDVRLVNLQEILDPLDIFRKYTGVRMQDIYNLMLKKGYTLGSKQMLPLMHGLVRLYHRKQVALLTKFWRRSMPELVVSLVPNFNRALFDSLRNADRASGRSPTPLVTILTDLADYPPHFWIEQQEQYFVCGTERAVEQAREMGHPDCRIFKTSGMIVRPRFYDPVEVSIPQERERLGLRSDLPTGLVLFGGQGSNRMVSIAKQVDRSGQPVQLIFICGKNQVLQGRLRELPLSFPHFLEGFTNEIPYYMRLSDFFIGKPGPGSISEAIAMKLPVILESNAWTLPQERYNAEWVKEKEVGVVLGSFREIGEGVKQMLEPEIYGRLRRNVEAINNRAVFEIPEILSSLLPRQTPPRRATRQP